MTEEEKALCLVKILPSHIGKTVGEDILGSEIMLTGT